MFACNFFSTARKRRLVQAPTREDCICLCFLVPAGQNNSHGGRSWSGPDPKGGGGGGGLYGPQNWYTEKCALSAPEAPDILFEGER